MSIAPKLEAHRSQSEREAHLVQEDYNVYVETMISKTSYCTELLPLFEPCECTCDIKIVKFEIKCLMLVACIGHSRDVSLGWNAFFAATSARTCG